MSEISPEMKRKIETVLKRVREPETGRSVGELNLVSRLRYSEKEKILQIFMNIGDPRSTCLVCSIVNEQLRSSIEREVLEEMGKEFPELRLELIP
jgi:metal-sulfur cluster biosynthetic enzyme